MSLTSLATKFAAAYTQPVEGTKRMGLDLNDMGVDDLSAQGAADSTKTTGAVADDLKSLTDFVPTEILTLYIAGIAAIENYKFISGDPTRTVLLQWIFLISVALCGLWVVAGIYIAAQSVLPLRAFVWPTLAGVIAFIVYAMAIPDSWIALQVPYGTLFASIAVLIVTPLLLLLTKLYNKLFPPAMMSQHPQA